MRFGSKINEASGFEIRKITMLPGKAYLSFLLKCAYFSLLFSFFFSYRGYKKNQIEISSQYKDVLSHKENMYLVFFLGLYLPPGSIWMSTDLNHKSVRVYAGNSL